MSNAKNSTASQKTFAETIHREEVRNRLNFAASAETEELLDELLTSQEGLSVILVPDIRDMYGDNKITRGRKVSLLQRVIGAFVNPFTAILFGLVVVSAFTDIILAAPGEADPTAVIIILTMVLVSGTLRFVQETRSGHAAENLLKLITTTTHVQRRETGSREIPLEEVVVGDMVHLAAGDMIPADMRIIKAKDLFVSQAAMVGESEPVEKLPHAVKDNSALTEKHNLALMGTDVISGSATGIVVATSNTPRWTKFPLISTAAA